MDPVLLIFAAVAGFILFRLFSVLGTRTGHEQRPEVEGVQRVSRASVEQREQAKAAPAERKLAPVSPQAAPLRAVDPDFDEKEFLEGARGAYELIVEAFASGDLKSIRRFLGQSVYEAFKAAVGERAARGLASELKFVGIDSAQIVSSEANAEEMRVVTDFASNQVRVTRDKDGKVVDGDPNRIDLVRDRWIFTRKTKSPDPNWILVATGAGA
jgi:predicted lipid-binding transport protein (Tim44 family)